ncbi:MAG: protein-export chaperone SecB [Devosiaceae bacterium]|nr:protein-export chaperone SecB [Devosiaceae bacterium MH13]
MAPRKKEPASSKADDKKSDDAAKTEAAKADAPAADAPANGGGEAAAAAAAAAAGTGAQTAPRFQALAQYVRDLSVENPNAPASMRGAKPQPKIDINVGVQVNPQPDGLHEVVLKLDCKAGQGKDMMFAVELDYAGLFRAENMTQEQTQVALMIEGPRLLFPFAREILANATRQAGFPPLMLDPVDFLALYRQRAMQSQQAKAS